MDRMTGAPLALAYARAHTYDGSSELSVGGGV